MNWKSPSLYAVGVTIAMLATSFPASGHHDTTSDTRLVSPSGIQVLAHVPVAAGYEPVPTPQHCLEKLAVTGAVYSQDFQGGAGGYSFIGTPLSSAGTQLWQHTTSAGPGANAGHSSGGQLYFGSTSTWNTNFGHVAGTAQGPSITVPAGQAWLGFATKWQTEWLKGYDHLWVEAKDTATGKVHLLCTSNAYDRVDPAGLGGNTVVASCSPYHFTICPLNVGFGWETRAIQFPSYLLGKTVQLRFTYDSADDKANPYMGWMVDDVVVGTGSSLSP